MHDTASIVQVIIPVPTVQLAYRQIDVWWFEVICAYWERERARESGDSLTPFVKFCLTETFQIIF